MDRNAIPTQIIAFILGSACLLNSCKPTISNNGISRNNLQNETFGSDNEHNEQVKVMAYPGDNVRSNLLLRKEPTIESQIIIQIPKDSAIGIIMKTDICQAIENNQSCWFRAKYHDNIGYVFGGFLWFRTLADLNIVDPKSNVDYENSNSSASFKSIEKTNMPSSVVSGKEHHVGVWIGESLYTGKPNRCIFILENYTWKASVESLDGKVSLAGGYWYGDAKDFVLVNELNTSENMDGRVSEDGRVLFVKFKGIDGIIEYERLSNEAKEDIRRPYWEGVF